MAEEMEVKVQEEGERVSMKPWEQHSAVISIPRFDYNAASSLLYHSQSGFLVTCPIKREKSATKEAMSILEKCIGIFNCSIYVSSESSDANVAAKRRKLCILELDSECPSSIESKSAASNFGDSSGKLLEDSCLTSAKSDTNEERSPTLSLVKLTGSGLLLFTIPRNDSLDVVDTVSKIICFLESGSLNSPLWCHRIFPIQATCCLNEKELRAIVSKLVIQFVNDKRNKLARPIKFAVGYNRRGIEEAELKISRNTSKDSEEIALLDRNKCFSVVPVLTRKPGSDRGLYEGRISSFFSPSRFSDQTNEDRFANEGSNPRASDYSVSSAGDPFKSDTQSPNFQRDIISPPYQTSRDILNEHIQRQTMSTFSESNTKTDADKVHRPQRTASSGSFGSFDSNSMSLKSVNSVGLVDIASESEQSGTNQDKQYADPPLQQSSVSGNFGGLDLFNAPFAPQIVPSASAIDLFQFPATLSTPPVDLFQPSSIASGPTLHAHQPSQTNPSSLDLFADMPHQQPAATLDKKSPDEVVPKNEGWATFDLPQHMASTQGIGNSTTAVVPPTDGGSLGMFDPHLLPFTSLQWPAFEDSNAHVPSSMPTLWHETPDNVQSANNATRTQAWNAFEDPTGVIPHGSIQQSSEEIAVHAPSTTVNQYLGDFGDGLQRAALDNGPLNPNVPLHVNGSSYASSLIPSMVGAQSHATDGKSINPFDHPYDSDFESSSMFLDMSSLQAALPSDQIPNTFLDGVTQPWFPQNPVPSYIPAAQQGALGFMGGPAPGTQMPNVPAQGPVASVGGNPFA